MQTALSIKAYKPKVYPPSMFDKNRKQHGCNFDSESCQSACIGKGRIMPNGRYAWPNIALDGKGKGKAMKGQAPELYDL